MGYRDSEHAYEIPLTLQLYVLEVHDRLLGLGPRYKV